MKSDLFDYQKLMEASDFGIKRYKNACYKGQISALQEREGMGV